MGDNDESQYPKALAPITYAWYRGGAAFSSRVLRGGPGRRAVQLFGTASSIALAQKRQLVKRHQRRILGPNASEAQVQQSVTGAFRSYARYWHELSRLPQMVRDGSLVRKMRTTGFEHIHASAAAGKGTILVLPHLGGFDAAGAYLASIGYPPLVVAERVEPVSVFEWFVQIRSEIGMTVEPMGPQAAANVAMALRENRVVCLLTDRDIAGDGVPVQFFGGATTMPAGPALLAIRTGAQILPVATYFEGSSGHYLRVLPPLDTSRQGSLREDLARITQDLATQFETLIRAAPEQWLVMVPFWKDDE